MSRRVVIVGASLAGATAATSLRRLGFDGDVLLVGAEPHLPYERPALSKGYLAGQSTAEQLLVQPAGTFAELGVELRLGRTAVALQEASRTVRLDDVAVLPYDALVIATGSTNLTPAIDGMQLDGVHQLRTLDEADRLRAHAARARSAVVVGMGFIGCEVSATLRGLGLDVTMVDRLGGPLWMQLGPQLSDVVRRWHVEHGVRLIDSVEVAALEGDRAVEGVRLSDGRLLPADLVVVGVGVRPATDWLASAPLHLEHGAVGVDANGRTNLSDVYAVGDVAAVWDDRTQAHRHVEHYRAALEQGARVAHALLDLPAPAAEPAWFWSEQYEHVLHYAGDHRAEDTMLVREQPFTAFFTRSAALTAVATVDNGRDFRRALRLLGNEVDERALVDPAVDLRRLRSPHVDERPAIGA